MEVSCDNALPPFQSTVRSSHLLNSSSPAALSRALVAWRYLATGSANSGSVIRPPDRLHNRYEWRWRPPDPLRVHQKSRSSVACSLNKPEHRRTHTRSLTNNTVNAKRRKRRKLITPPIKFNDRRYAGATGTNLIEANDMFPYITH